MGVRFYFYHEKDEKLYHDKLISYRKYDNFEDLVWLPHFISNYSQEGKGKHSKGK